ncbi:MAG TPA: twin-arginine translocation signal domain-containing protein, partial [Candidatus Hydrogenedentes bacterium]|nr:twin-arginine translocation signal domain-containing protein [Candidatus Hydrogenedentota bacterium]
MPSPLEEHALLQTRRQFFGRCACGIGAAALGSLLSPAAFANQAGAQLLPHFAG